MKPEKDRRRHGRLPLRLEVLCQKVGSSGAEVYPGKTINVSPGGMLIEVNDHQTHVNQLLNIEMVIPPTDDMLEYSQSFSSHARVLRIEAGDGQSQNNHSSGFQRLALQFCEPPKFNI